MPNAIGCAHFLFLGKIFKRAAGSQQSMTEEAKRRNQSHMHAPGSALLGARPLIWLADAFSGH